MILHETDTTDLKFSHEIEETSLQILMRRKKKSQLYFQKYQHQVYIHVI